MRCNAIGALLASVGFVRQTVGSIARGSLRAAATPFPIGGRRGKPPDTPRTTTRGCHRDRLNPGSGAGVLHASRDATAHTQCRSLASFDGRRPSRTWREFFGVDRRMNLLALITTFALSFVLAFAIARALLRAVLSIMIRANARRVAAASVSIELDVPDTMSADFVTAA
jgi:hypothetical protein